MSKINNAVLSAILSVCACAPAQAQEAAARQPDAARGLEIARALCVNCHLTGADGSGSAIAGVPTFQHIADRPGQTAARITGFLLVPHAAMPNTKLSVPEIHDLIAYLDTLRAADAGAPLLPKKTPPRFRPETPEQG